MIENIDGPINKIGLRLGPDLDGSRLGLVPIGSGPDWAGLYSPGLKWAWTRMAGPEWVGLDWVGPDWDDRALFLQMNEKNVPKTND